MSNCTELAAKLSRNYRNNEPFLPQHPNNPTAPPPNLGSLSDYLSRAGILLTMCFPFQCTIPLGSDHISGSWIQQQIGASVIQGPSIGLILDPQRVDIQCLYPTDAASVERDDAGCGAPFYDPIKGSKGAQSMNWATKQIFRWEYTKFKDFNFGSETAWKDIDCEFLFPELPPGPTAPGIPDYALAWRTALHSRGKNENDKQLDSSFDDAGLPSVKYQDLMSLSKSYIDAIMGHSICRVPANNHTNPNPEYVFLLHQGAESWAPLEWQAAVDLQKNFVQHKGSPSVLFHWNEVIIALPKHQLQDVVTGVFFMTNSKEDDRLSLTRAQKIAKLMGDKPVMRMNPYSTETEDILECPEAVEKDGNEYNWKVDSTVSTSVVHAILAGRKATVPPYLHGGQEVENKVFPNAFHELGL